MGETGSKQRSSEPREPAEHTDPVCGMTVDPADAATSHQYRGKTYYFCNPKCLEKFKADPGRYVEQDAEEKKIEQAPTGAIYTCPMHPEVRQDRPGDCPKCGMALEPAETHAEEEESPELKDMSRRFWVSLALTVPVVIIAMSLRREWR